MVTLWREESLGLFATVDERLQLSAKVGHLPHIVGRFLPLQFEDDSLRELPLHDHNQRWLVDTLSHRM